MLEFFIPICE